MGIRRFHAGSSCNERPNTCLFGFPVKCFLFVFLATNLLTVFTASTASQPTKINEPEVDKATEEIIKNLNPGEEKTVILNGDDEDVEFDEGSPSRTRVLTVVLPDGRKVDYEITDKIIDDSDAEEEENDESVSTTPVTISHQGNQEDITPEAPILPVMLPDASKEQHKTATKPVAEYQNQTKEQPEAPVERPQQVTNVNVNQNSTLTNPSVITEPDNGLETKPPSPVTTTPPPIQTATTNKPAELEESPLKEEKSIEQSVPNQELPNEGNDDSNAKPNATEPAKKSILSKLKPLNYLSEGKIKEESDKGLTPAVKIKGVGNKKEKFVNKSENNIKPPAAKPEVVVEDSGNQETEIINENKNVIEPAAKESPKRKTKLGSKSKAQKDEKEDEVQENDVATSANEDDNSSNNEEKNNSISNEVKKEKSSKKPSGTTKMKTKKNSKNKKQKEDKKKRNKDKGGDNESDNNSTNESQEVGEDPKNDNDNEVNDNEEPVDSGDKDEQKTSTGGEPNNVQKDKPKSSAPKEKVVSANRGTLGDELHRIPIPQNNQSPSNQQVVPEVIPQTIVTPNQPGMQTIVTPGQSGTQTIVTPAQQPAAGQTVVLPGQTDSQTTVVQPRPPTLTTAAQTQQVVSHPNQTIVIEETKTTIDKDEGSDSFEEEKTRDGGRRRGRRGRWVRRRRRHGRWNK